MKNTCSLLAGIALLVIAAPMPMSYAGQYSDLDVINEFLDSGNPTYSDTFDIINDAVAGSYDPVAESVTSAQVSFSLANNDFVQESFLFTLGEQEFSQGSFRFVFTLPSTSITGTLLGAFSATGVISYQVDFTGGTGFTLVQASLTAETTPNSPPVNSVPEGGMTLSFLSLGLVSLTWLRRKLKS